MLPSARGRGRIASPEAPPDRHMTSPIPSSSPGTDDILDALLSPASPEGLDDALGWLLDDDPLEDMVR